MKVNVVLNGTDTNPFHKFGLKRNPFPQIARAEYAAANDLLARLEAEPIKDTSELRSRLDGCSDEFIDLCCAQFKPGEMARFTIEFERP
jgi:hypothetical protein